METRKINYRSDFDFVLDLKTCEGKEIGFPDYDFKIFLYTTSNRASGITASCINGKCTNLFNDNGKVHIVCNSHNLGVGDLKMDFTAYLPDALFPDGDKRVVTPTDLAITLVVGEGDCAPLSEVEYIVPYIYVSAYELAKSAGYEGTLEEYTQALNDVVEIVEEAKNVNALMSDWVDGKKELSEALRKWDVDSQPSDSFIKMRDDIMNLPVRGESEEGVLPQTYCGAMPFDLLQVLNNNRRAEYPYMFGIQFGNVLDDTDYILSLSGADAYLTSDGSFYTEDTTHQFDRYANYNFVIFYFRKDVYTVAVPKELTAIQRIVALEGKPRFALNLGTSVTIGSVESYVSEKYDITESGGFDFSANIYNINITGVTYAFDSYMQPKSLNSFNFPDLKKLNISTNIAFTGTLKVPIFEALEEIENPNNYVYLSSTFFTIIYYPKLKKTYTRQFAFNMNDNLKEIILPELEELNSTLASNVGKIEHLYLPKLKVLRSGSIINGTGKMTILDLPELERLENNASIIQGTSSIPLELNIPKLNYTNGNILNGSHQVSKVNAPSLKHHAAQTLIYSAQNLVEYDFPVLEESNGTIFNGCDLLKEIYLPELRMYSANNANIVNNCPNVELINLPKLEENRGSYLWTGNINVSKLVINLPSLKRTANSSGQNASLTFFNSDTVGRADLSIEYHFGAPEDGYIYFTHSRSSANVKIITVEEGFRSYLNISNFPNIEKECLENIIHNLADNNFYATLQIVFGATNLAKLSDEIKLEATNKNYTLS